MMRVNLGSGDHTPPGWVHVDGSLGARLSRHPRLRSLLVRLGLAPPSVLAWKDPVTVHDLTRPLPWKTGTVDVLYCSHTLEHLYLHDAQALLREANRVLKPGGVARFAVPDLEALARAYLDGRLDRKAHEPEQPQADLLNRRLGYRLPTAPAGPRLLRAYRALHDFHAHKWLYDATSLAHHMRDAGFVGVRRCGYLESSIEGIEGIERAGRVGPFELAIEAHKAPAPSLGAPQKERLADSRATLTKSS